MTFKRSLGFQGELVSTRAPRALILSVTPPWDGVRISRLHRSTRTFICVRSSARLLFAAVSISRVKPFWLGGNRYTQGFGGARGGHANHTPGQRRSLIFCVPAGSNVRQRTL